MLQKVTFLRRGLVFYATSWLQHIFFCGERGIRTPGGCYTPTVFKTAAIDHSAISPAQKYKNYFSTQQKNTGNNEFLQKLYF